MIKPKALLIYILLFVFPVFISAQINHFMYLQTEGRQPFYAKVDKKILSSSASGYLIIPKLKNGQFNFTIGFPKSENPEQTFTCTIDNADIGYLIKNFGEKGWGLFNLQTLDVVLAGLKNTTTEIGKAEKSDEFSAMLSQAVNDPAIKQAGKTNVSQNQQSLDVNDDKKTPVITTNVIVRKELITNKSGLQVLYIDKSGDKPDTIEIFIPTENILDNESELAATQIKVKAVTEAALFEENKNTDQVKSEKPVEIIEEHPIEIVEEKKLLPLEIKTDSVVEKSSAGIQMVNSDCKSYASNEDFLKLRKKMAGQDSDEAMITVAQKAFKSKCYTTEQVKNLSVLFLKDAGKYHFFDVAYQFVSDSSNFGILEEQLSEEYYISRFKAMLRH